MAEFGCPPHRSSRSLWRCGAVFVLFLVVVALGACADSQDDADTDTSNEVERTAELRPPVEPASDSDTVPTTVPTTAAATNPASSSPDEPARDGQNAQDALVRTGAGVLVDSGFAQLRNKRVGLIANHTSQVDGIHLIDHLVEADEVELVAVFAPEHGVRGNADAGETFGDETDPTTGTPIRSLYGELRQPTPDMLADIDVLVYDLQDVGTRTYTYISTMGLAMQTAAATGVEFLVLDRPNPLGNTLSDGPVLDAEQISFIGQYQIPLAYGLTVGELAQAIVAEGLIADVDSLRLEVVPVDGWTSGMQWPDTGLDWVPPSPGLPTFESALAYPGTVLFEATSLSYGTGSEYPFSSVGATWLDADLLASTLNDVDLPGVRFEPIEYTPRPIPNISPNPKLEGELLAGVRIDITEPRRFQPVEAAIYLLDAVYDQARANGITEVIDRPATMDLLSGTSRLRTQLDDNIDPATIISGWTDELEAFTGTADANRLYR